FDPRYCTDMLKTLDPKQRKALVLLQEYSVITAKQIGDFFGFKPRTASQLCSDWVADGFLDVVNPSNKARTYKISDRFSALINL
ncbi:MAG: cell filamentation protein Fic, partial [Pseudomonadota bacterium]